MLHPCAALVACVAVLLSLITHYPFSECHAALPNTAYRGVCSFHFNRKPQTTARPLTARPQRGEMTTTELPERLRGFYDQVIGELNPRRGNLTNTFQSKIGDAVFEAGCSALANFATDTHKLMTVSARCGTGKTSFAYALAAAITRLAEADPSTPYGIVFLVEQKEQAERAYCELVQLLPPEKVRVWTEDHDIAGNKSDKIKVHNPAARCSKADLAHAPVIIVTQKFYLGKDGHLTRTVVRNGVVGQRALTIVDEGPDEAPSQELTLAVAQTAREALVDSHPETKPYLDKLFQIMEACNYGPKNQLFRPLKEWSERMVWELGWFRSKEADVIAKEHSERADVHLLFSYAKGLVSGYSWAVTDGRRATFYTYATCLVIDRTASAVLLDATADIDGRSMIVPWREKVETPQASYENLEIVLLKPHTKTILSRFFKNFSNRRAYTDWMKDALLQHTRVGDKVLLVCRLTLFENRNVPWWPTDDERFNNAESYTKGFQWDFKGRKLCAIHYGAGIGSNEWKDANVVFLCDDFVLPKAAAVCTTQGMRSQRANQGDLGAMATLSSKPEGVVTISDGHVLRQIVQLASRGNLRNYDEHGVCGNMRLLIACDQKRFMSNVEGMFPGVRHGNIKIVEGVSDSDTVQTKVLSLLSSTLKDVLRTKEISRHIRREWRAVGHYVNTPAFERSYTALGWEYVPNRGCKGAYFQRLSSKQSKQSEPNLQAASSHNIPEAWAAAVKRFHGIALVPSVLPLWPPASGPAA
jgi:hypothetical protein